MVDEYVNGLGVKAFKDGAIAQGAALSAAVDGGGPTASALQLPAANAWTDANITFDGSFDDVTYGPVLADNHNTEYVVTMPATAALKNQIVPLDLDVFAGIRYLKIRSGTAAAPVNQAAARSIRIVFRPV